MSIAVSAVIRTPVCLRVLQACLGVCALLAAWPLSGVGTAALTPQALVGGYALAWPAALLSASGGVLLLALLCARRKLQTLDISPVGQLRLTVYLEHAAGRGVGDGGGGAEPAAQVLRLLPASTLWPGLLLLRLGAAGPDDGDAGASEGGAKVISVLVQRGRRTCPAFRPLAVACRAIAARGREQ